MYDLVEDQDKRLWIATMGAGLFYYDLKTGQSVYDPKFNAATEKYKWISCLLYAGDNHLYVGTYDGIRCIGLSTDDFKTEEILSRHIIHSLYEDPQGNIWIGSYTGGVSVAILLKHPIFDISTRKGKYPFSHQQQRK